MIENNRDVIEHAYSPEAYGEQLLSIYGKLLSAKPGTIGYADGDALLDAFLAPERFNLLRT